MKAPAGCLAIVAVTIWGTLAEAQSNCVVGTSLGASAGIHFSAPSGTALGAGMTMWESACGPALPPWSQSSSSQSGVINIAVFEIAQGYACNGNSNACGCTEKTLSQGQIVSGMIFIFDESASGGDCTGNNANDYAHEIGHVLGFGHATDSSCSGNVMSPSASGSGITMGQCDFIDNNWEIPDEDPCDNNPQPQGCDNGQDPIRSPIVIDLARDGFRFTSPAVGVSFDFDGDGEVEETAWVGDHQDAFLVRDLNGNGVVDDGRELFGNYTLLADGAAASNGFEALAELDRPENGGNADGLIDRYDLGHDALALWRDWNLDGATDDGELIALSAGQIESISLRYRQSRQQDRFGNMLTFWSQVRLWHEGKLLPTWAADVFFQASDP